MKQYTGYSFDLHIGGIQYNSYFLSSPLQICPSIVKITSETLSKSIFHLSYSQPESKNIGQQYSVFKRNSKL